MFIEICMLPKFRSGTMLVLLWSVYSGNHIAKVRVKGWERSPTQHKMSYRKEGVYRARDESWGT